ncbi:hypothetical protein K440DRAFT_645689 [Wilcoxina mikolae CBS 423.85]|nr:hypothetical protein K440DRAFT_645689 [Wilcoxina mikolae CBS 423.85]
MSNPTEEDIKVINLDICPYGDMEIALTTSTIDVTYRVSSHQLCSGSSFFLAMLGPDSSFLEAKELRNHQSSASGSLFRVTAEEEHDPTALAVVLYVLHGRAEHIPESVTIENLFEIAIICDYYDCAASMRPWDEIWMSPLRSLASMSGYENWLFISWVFGDQDIFGQMTARFSKSGVMVGGEFGIMVDGDLKRLDYHIPQGVIDAMADQRAKIGEEIVRTCRLHKSFKSINLLNAGAGFQADLELEAIFQCTKSVMDGVANNLHNLRIGNYIHSSCYTAVSVVQSLQSILQGIKPLYLTSFSGNSAASDAESTWSTFLREEGTFSRPTSSCRTERSAEVFSLDVCKYGDMEIVLKSNTGTIPTVYSVSSHQLRAGSRIFRNLLDQDSAFQGKSRHGDKQAADSASAEEANQAQHYQLEVVKNYDPAIFAVFLFVLHASVQKLPEGTMHFQYLINLVAVCDDYECSVLLQPWHGKWVDNWRQYSENPGYEDWLFVAWALGEDKIFQSLTKKFSESGIVQDNEFVVVADEDHAVKDVKHLCKFIPEVIIDSMIAQRNTAAEKIIHACRGVYEKYDNYDTTTKRCNLPVLNKSSKICDHFIFGELHLGLKDAGLLLAGVLSFPPDISLNRTVMDLKKLSTSISSRLHPFLG